MNKKNEVVLPKDNFVFNSEEKINSLIKSANFDYGQSMFLINKEDYQIRLENKNPYFKLINISSVFPNKIFVYAMERKETFCLQSENKMFLLDEDFKILNISNKPKNNKKQLIEILFNRNNLQTNFFDFFEISDFAFDPGQYAWENNLIFSSIKNLSMILNSNYSLTLKDISSILIKEQSSGTINLYFNTKTESYGVKLLVKNVSQNFDKKLEKLVNAFNTLIKNEKIKTTYGCLSIDDNLNCFWNNL